MSGRVVRLCPVLIVTLVTAGGEAANPIWNCSDTGENSTCNTCAGCCHDYIRPQANCDQCVMDPASGCDFTCSNGTCSVCPECCESYIPNGDTCALCFSQQCTGGASVDRPPEPDTAKWMCKEDRNACNTCDACCRDYISDEGCATCVDARCTLVCSDPGTCNVCPECCQDYIPNGESCGSCVRQRCKTVNNTGWTPPPASPAPPASSDGWSCVEETTDCRLNNTCECNSCGDCCKNYVTQGASCSTCSTQDCEFRCQEKDDGNGGTLPCNVCNECCFAFIPDGESCMKCVKEYCFGHSAIPPPSTPAPLPASEGWTCSSAVGTCNACETCCKDYVSPGEPCASCAKLSCNFICSAQDDCNVCEACCKSYITGDECALCAKENCRNDGSDTAPVDPTPSPTVSPTRRPSKPGETSPPQDGSPTMAPDTPPPVVTPAPKKSSATLAIILSVVGGVLFCIVLIVVLLKVKGVRLVSRHRGAGPRRREQMGKLEDLQAVELEREAALRDGGGGDSSYYKGSYA